MANIRQGIALYPTDLWADVAEAERERVEPSRPARHEYVIHLHHAGLEREAVAVVDLLRGAQAFDRRVQLRRTLLGVNEIRLIAGHQEAESLRRAAEARTRRRAENERRRLMLVAYFDHLNEAAESDPVLNRDVLVLARRTWDELYTRLGDALRIPFAGPGTDGGFSLAWRAERLYFEIEIETDGTRGVFFKDKGVPETLPDWEELALWYEEAAPGQPLPDGAFERVGCFLI